MIERASKFVGDVSPYLPIEIIATMCISSQKMILKRQNEVHACNERELMHKYLKEGLLATKKIALQI